MKYPDNLLKECGIGKIQGKFSDNFKKKFDSLLKAKVFTTLSGNRNLEMLKLRYEKNMTYPNIADRYSTTYQNVQQIVSTAVKKIEKLMTDKDFLLLLAEEDVEISDSKTAKKLSSMQKKQKKYSKYSKVPIEKLMIPDRISNALHRAGYHTVEDLLNGGIKKISKVRNLGEKSVRIIAETLVKEYGAGKEWREL